METSFNPLLDLEYQPVIENLSDDYYDIVAAAEFPVHLLRFRNDDLLTLLGLEPNTVSDANFIDAFYTDADAATAAVNDWVEQSDDIMAPLKARRLLTDEPFDEPIDFVYFELWHHWGRTTKFGAWMGGPDYTQWHGAYEVLSDLAELRELVAERLAEGMEGE